MTLVKIIKDRAYFKRFQVKFRRRIEGKTDYYARRAMVTQAKNKYNTPKYRLVVRSTNTMYICQIVMSKIAGDIVLASARSTELRDYGIPVGLTNYPAAYCTGLLCARRALTKLKLDGKFPQQKSAKLGEDYETKPNSRRQFMAILDVGLSRTTNGARIFAAMKGAVDGGVCVPHSDQRLPGYDKEKSTLDTAKLRHRILGGHVADYHQSLLDEKDDKLKQATDLLFYREHFTQYIKNKISPKDIIPMYMKAHEMIREDPMRSIEEKNKKPKVEYRHVPRPVRLTKAQRRESALKKKEAYVAAIRSAQSCA